MADTTPHEVKRIISTVLHHIDIDAEKCTLMPISSGSTDLEGYLKELLSEINNREQKRSYEFLRQTTEFYVALASFSANSDLVSNAASTNLAERLLVKEVATDARYGHLSATGTGHVKKGSFLQFMYKEGEVVSYLGVKIEHQSFLDEDDFKRKIGLSIANKIYKACKVSYRNDGEPSDVLVFDTNAKPATYWWQDFLELSEARDDSFNTRKSSQEVMKVINSIKKDFPVDHTILRNAAVAAFKQDGEMKYDEFIANTFLKYNPENPALIAKMPALIKELQSLPERKNFDTRFNLVSSEVHFTRSKIALTREITLSFDEGMENLDEKIWSEKSADGKKLVVIESADGFDKFKFKERETD